MANRTERMPAYVNRQLSANRAATPQRLTGVTETAPTLSAQEVQAAVNNGQQANNSQIAGGLTLENQAAQNAATNLGAISGMGNAGRGSFYGAVGAGGQITDPAAFMAGAPGVYNSPYAPAMQNIMNGLLSQKPFQYDVNADGLYQQIKDNYVKQGRQAMMDTQGQSAALTGGYGNSYGVTAGQQAYQDSLGNLAGMIPELQQLAYQQYLQDQDAQRNNLEALNKLDQQEYARWADEQAAYQELLKTMPAMSAGGGGMSDFDVADRILKAMGAKNVADGKTYNTDTMIALQKEFEAGRLNPYDMLTAFAIGDSYMGIDKDTGEAAALQYLGYSPYTDRMVGHEDTRNFTREDSNPKNIRRVYPTQGASTNAGTSGGSNEDDNRTKRHNFVFGS